MGLPSYFFTKGIDQTWRLLELLEAWMIRINSNELPSKMCIPLDKELRTGNSSADEAPFEGINEAGYGKEFSERCSW